MNEENERGCPQQPLPPSSAAYEYNTLMRLMGVSVSKHLMDDHFTLVWANEFYYKLIGWPKAEYEAKYHNRPDLYYANDMDLWNELAEVVMDAVAKGQKGYKLVTRMPQKNGGYVWVQMTNQFSEEYINGYQVSYTVITNIDELVKMQQEQSITYNSLPGFVAKYLVGPDLQLTLLDCNDRFKEYFGEAQGPPGGNRLYWKNIEDNWDVIEAHREAVLTGGPAQFVMHVTSRAGDALWLQVNATCIDWREGCPVYLAIFIDITDVTELREMHQKLTEQKAALQEALAAAELANKAKSDFLSRMSHDIRTPMNAIMGMAAIAAAHIDDKDRVLDCLSKIDVSSKLLLSLINEVLDMSRIESGRLAIAEEPFSLNEVIQNVVTMTQPSIMEKHHTFDIRAYNLQHEQVVGDPRRMEQVFLNILSNAIKYTPDGGTITLELRELPSEKEGYGRYEFAFRDNGYGMEPAFLQKIFMPFERAKDAAVYAIQGTGLGMAISQNVVRMMDGDIQVESTYGEGSNFTVNLYLKLQSEAFDDLELPGPMAILVVDDDPIACETTCEYLEELGIGGDFALSGNEAVEKAAAAQRSGNGFAAVIMDLRMPNTDGIATAKRIRREVSEQIPILLLSAYDWSDCESDAREAKINGFIAKPMLKSSLINAIKRFVLGQRPAAPKALMQSKRSFAGRHLLLVEDNELNREIAKEVLNATGAQVDTANNGLEAVNKFADSPDGYYSLIFMDIQMPVMGGIEAACRIRGLCKGDAAAVPIVAMTANVFTEDVARSRDAGMNAHLAKPLDFDKLQQVLEQYIPD